MPTIALKSKVRTELDHCSLSLNIRHRLLLGQTSDPVFDVKPIIPEAVDVLLLSNLLITVSGSLDGTRITPAELKASHIANHLVDFLQTHAGDLGINAVSGLYISEDNPLLSLTLTACRHCPPSNDTLPAHLQLIALDLDYVWQTNSKATSGRLDTAINPFARHLSLPYLTATDNTVGRFVSFHLVRRYPLIFGPWCKQLDVESNFFPSILISIQSIMERSRNPVFRDTCQDLFKVCKRKIMSTSLSAAGALSKYLGVEAGAYLAPETYTYNEEEAILLCLERFYRFGMKRPKFRHLSLVPTITTGSSEDLLSDALVTDTFGANCSSNQSSEASGLLPHVSLFEGTYMDWSSDIELNTENEHRVALPDSYQNNNASQESLEQINYLIDTPVEWAEMSDQGLCDDIYDLFEDEVGSCRAFSERRHFNKDDSKDDSPDLAVDSDIDCLLEEPDDWSPDDLSYQEYDQDFMGNISFPGVYSLVQPLKMPTSLYSTNDFEHILDPLHLGLDRKHNSIALVNSHHKRPTIRSLSQTEDMRACAVSQECSSGDHYVGLGSDMLTKPVITDGDHGIIVAPKSSQAFNSRSETQDLFSDQQSVYGYGRGLAIDGGNSGVITDEDSDRCFLVIEYDSDVAE